jgi:RNA polymerase sigma-70 factor, ECF subfamily
MKLLAMDKDRFDKEIAPHTKHLRTACMRLTQNEFDADDLCQEVLIKAYTHIHQLQANTSPKAWLVRIARNMFINDYRKRSRNVEFEYLESDGEGDNEDIDKGTEDEPLYSENVSEAILALPDDCQNILLLSDVYGFSKKEISVMHGIPHGTARARLFKARQILRAQLEDYAMSKGIKTKLKHKEYD